MSDREVVGKTKCLNCNEAVTVKRNIKGHLYYNCSWGDSGCGSQFQSRTNDADAHLFRKLEKKETPANKEEPKQAENVDDKQEKPAEKEESYWDHMA